MDSSVGLDAADDPTRNHANLPSLHKHPFEPVISGLRLIPDFITQQEELDLIASIDAHPWSGYGIPPNPELKRHTQQYGFLFSFRTRTITECLGSLPAFSSFVIDRMLLPEFNVFPNDPPNHVLVNEYQPGQGIMPHVDSQDTFGDVVTSLSLWSSCVMSFGNKMTGEKVHLELPRRSLLILTGDARTHYTHAIPKEDMLFAGNECVDRGRRVSLTIRSILKSAIP
ncbi:hypothetical protein BATDEDRAFT_87049 [Batrachochytrium dendrobatidis JAM81]|uniref:Fe2OG dioxygenase domain-containing protein n=2 Tax=Batrachochytrium dendrobatidis TaxID=109871 RepID=F4NY73_BATDJ|nr:uncharacterized protein BATDEDRAFT_87049 [Batrachochytrium dendrobatidis JAM81]EGF82271.1 hypothetical protein BATDEDRAFT_87049 [Batrachochytrium dendrobatidis JAM81]KAJ8324347.1 hypothetical protein O5D80_006611 [Batrachochytrium dendrobatidis]KAK5670599.1 hypothetical protein QVD99_002383 [Batrachochytrium dendrobatidis]OAJ40736.1 hypothetical protein BDEG_24437 [Batrachochytrium dendrobatidis JEL423]|eukprot:XP_006677689.1 hypothetical protein BATDEDRAFT_87049 [Batrachochytrium dendrobatidis JAM81]